MNRRKKNDPFFPSPTSRYYRREAVRKNPVAPDGSKFSLVCVGRVRAARGQVLPEEMFQFVGICWCIAGELELHYDGVPVILRPGWVSICFPGTLALCTVAGDSAEFALLAFDGADAVKNVIEAGLWEGEFPSGPPPTEWLDLLYERLDKAGWDGDDVASSIAFDLLVRLGDAVRRNVPDKLAHEARQVVHTRWSEASFNVADLALRLGVDRSTLYRRFRLATGLGISDYLAALRTKEACRLLKTTALPVAAIGKAVGLPTPTYFSRFFVRQTGLSPRSYRNIP